MTKQYYPSNGLEGLSFREQFCFRCKRDVNYYDTENVKDSCPILNATLRGEKVKQWKINGDGEAYCSEFEN